MKRLNILSDGMGSWGYCVVKPLVKLTFPHVEITHDNEKTPDLIVRSHFKHLESRQFGCPYISWSGECGRVSQTSEPPVCEINTFDCPQTIYFPLLAAESKSIRPSVLTNKKYCCAYAFSNRIQERELVFKLLRSLEPTCYAFGPSCFTSDNPFALCRDNRMENSRAFKDFGFMVAMENRLYPGYITEKIGHAFESGTIPIYDSRNGVDRFFNPNSFFDLAHRNYEKACEEIVHTWKDPHKMQRYFDAPLRVNNELEKYENLSVEWPWMLPCISALKEAFPDL